jgi:predicted chitinase
MAEFCGRKGEECPGGYRQYFGRGPLQLTWENNYKVMGSKLVPSVDLLANPAIVADNTKDISWRTSLRFWFDSDFLCGGKWGELQSLPTCPEAARSGNLATVTRRINPLECNGGPYASFQPGRIAQVQQVRSLWGMPPLTQTTC